MKIIKNATLSEDKDLQIPDFLIEEGYGRTNVNWYKESLGLTPIQKILKLCEFNNLDSKLTILNMDKYGVKWLCTKHNYTEQAYVSDFISKVGYGICSRCIIEEIIKKTFENFETECKRWGNQDAKYLTFPNIFEDLCAIEDNVIAGQIFNITCKCEKHGNFKASERLWPYGIYCDNCRTERVLEDLSKKNRYFKYKTERLTLSENEIIEILNIAGITGKILEISEGYYSKYSYFDTVFIDFDGGYYRVIILDKVSLRGYCIQTNGINILIKEFHKFQDYNRNTEEFAQLCLDNLKEGAFYVEHVFRENKTNKITVTASCSVCEKTQKHLLSAWPAHINCNHGIPLIRSSGEIVIYKYLQAQGILFEEQHSIYNNGYLRFDFYVQDRRIAIEFNGPQHYEFIEFFHKVPENFIKQQERDKRKLKYCENNDIKLIVIDGRSFNKEDTIIKELEHLLG